jgi:hypothetical protein
LIPEGEFGMLELETPAGGVEEEAEPEITIKKISTGGIRVKKIEISIRLTDR